MTCWRRPAYTGRVLDSLRKATGIGSYHLFVSVDGEGDPAVEKLLGRVDFCPFSVSSNGHHIGCNANTHAALAMAFTEADYVIHLEDDTPLAPDALRFFEWCKQFGNDSRVFTVSAWGVLPRPSARPNDSALAVMRQHFSCWAWATWKDRWLEMQAKWTVGPDHSQGGDHTSWDFVLDRNVRGARFQIQPVVSRTTNIGSDLGTHRGDCLVVDWAGSPGFQAPPAYIADWL